VSNRALWALAVDALHERKALRQDVDSLKRKATLWWAASGLVTAMGAMLIALASRLI